MTKYFFNLSNHPADKWDSTQLNAAISFTASQRGCDNSEVQIIDLPFPKLDPQDNGRDWDTIVPRQFRNMLFEVGYVLSPKQGIVSGAQVDEETGETIAVDFTEGITPEDCIFHIAGEPVWVYNVVKYLHSQGYGCVTSTTNREVVETTAPDGTTTKTSVFKFCGFRVY